MMKKRYVLIALIALAPMLGACDGSSASNDPVPRESQKGYEIWDEDLSTFEATLPSGRRIECVALTARGSALWCVDVNE